MHALVAVAPVWAPFLFAFSAVTAWLPSPWVSRGFLGGSLAESLGRPPVLMETLLVPLGAQGVSLGAFGVTFSLILSGFVIFCGGSATLVAAAGIHWQPGVPVQKMCRISLALSMIVLISSLRPRLEFPLANMSRMNIGAKIQHRMNIGDFGTNSISSKYFSSGTCSTCVFFMQTY